MAHPALEVNSREAFIAAHWFQRGQHPLGLIDALLKRNKPGEARSMLSRLQRIEPESPRTREMHARVEAAAPPKKG